MMASTRRTSTDRGHHVENGKRAAHAVGAILPEACLGLPAELESVDRLLDDPVFFEPYRGALPLEHRSPVDPDRDLSAAHVLEVPLSARLRAAVPGGRRLDLLAALLPDPARGERPAPDDADEDHDALWVGGGRAA